LIKDTYRGLYRSLENVVDLKFGSYEKINMGLV